MPTLLAVLPLLVLLSVLLPTSSPVFGAAAAATSPARPATAVAAAPANARGRQKIVCHVGDGAAKSRGAPMPAKATIRRLRAAAARRLHAQDRPLDEDAFEADGAWSFFSTTPPKDGLFLGFHGTSETYVEYINSMMPGYRGGPRASYNDVVPVVFSIIYPSSKSKQMVLRQHHISELGIKAACKVVGDGDMGGQSDRRVDYRQMVRGW
ncbi:hypothetical protein HK405_005305 [Cladochytrium tenue]|nr:hypothetical protein HK405_005305 [Cladochytrium tenue]